MSSSRLPQQAGGTDTVQKHRSLHHMFGIRTFRSVSGRLSRRRRRRAARDTRGRAWMMLKRRASVVASRRGRTRGLVERPNLWMLLLRWLRMSGVRRQRGVACRARHLSRLWRNAGWRDTIGTPRRLLGHWGLRHLVRWQWLVRSERCRSLHPVSNSILCLSFQ